MNVINLMGRITKNPELRQSSGGKKYCAFTLAINEYIGGQQVAQFVPCFAWEKTAENLATYVIKGQQIIVEGSLNVRQENNNGQYNNIITVRANRIEFLASDISKEPKTNNNYSYKSNNFDDQETTTEFLDEDDNVQW